MPATPLEAIKLAKDITEKAVIELGMVSAMFDASSESADRFTYAMYAAGLAYMGCDIMEKNLQAQDLGINHQNSWSDFFKIKKENILSSIVATAAVFTAGTVTIFQDPDEKAKGADLHKQIPAALLAGIASFYYLQSSKEKEQANSQKKTELREREVAEPFEQGITNAIQTLTGLQPQQQSQADLVSQLSTVVQSTKLELDNTNQMISNLIEDLAKKADTITELTQQNRELGQVNHALDLQLRELQEKSQILKESTEMAQEDKLSWAQRVSEGSKKPNQSREV